MFANCFENPQSLLHRNPLDFPFLKKVLLKVSEYFDKKLDLLFEYLLTTVCVGWASISLKNDYEIQLLQMISSDLAGMDEDILK
mmetsp:Transcript_30057/g.39554  ORF Transcript_30057/g.39554 Transcript_30057/m.39554 type:complete len:84 (+) Transcript_30057:336-587(+)